MASNLDDAFGTLADADMWEEAAAVAAGFLAPTLVRNLAEGRTDMDIPDEIYGIAVVFLGQYAPAYGGMVSLGGGVYTVDVLLERVGLKQTVTGGNL